MTGAIHQFVPSLEPSAVGFHALELQRMVREMLGRPSEVFTAEVHAGLAGKGRPHTDYGAAVPARSDDVLIYQLAVGSVVADFVRSRSRPVVVNYHNMTPARFLCGWDPGASHAVTWGRRQLRELAGCTELGIAVSAFNGGELVEAGYRRTTVVPVLVDLEELEARRDVRAERRLEAAKRRGGADWLFVGRLAPNKCQHQVVKAFAVYRRLYDPDARLWLVGGSSSSTYATALERFVNALGLSGAVTLTGSVPQGVLVSHYRRADVFVCLSEHEGFCVPLLEAMWHRVPIVALGAAAVPETLGPAGVLLPVRSGRQPTPAVVAAAVHRVLSDGSLRDRLIASGAERVEQFSLERTRRRFAQALSQVMEPC
jgi:glycosyltransferase involved in cell wall biosynthesis